MQKLTQTNALVYGGAFLSAGGAALAAGKLTLGAVLALIGLGIGVLTFALSRRPRR